MERLMQILLVAVILVLTSLLTLIGVQFYQFLREIKKSSALLNEALASWVRTSQAISEPLADFFSFLSGLKFFLKKEKENGEGKKEK